MKNVRELLNPLITTFKTSRIAQISAGVLVIGLLGMGLFFWNDQNGEQATNGETSTPAPVVPPAPTNGVVMVDTPANLHAFDSAPAFVPTITTTTTTTTTTTVVPPPTDDDQPGSVCATLSLSGQVASNNLDQCVIVVIEPEVVPVTVVLTADVNVELPIIETPIVDLEVSLSL